MPSIKHSSTIFRGRVFEVEEALVEEAGQEYQREIVIHKGSSVIVPIHKDGSIFFVKQFRLAAGKALLELPAGSIEKGETPEECALREVEEEIGYAAHSVKEIAQFYVSPGFLTEKMHLFVTQSLEKSQQNLEVDEHLEVIRLDPGEARELVLNGGIEDAKSMIAILILFGQNGAAIDPVSA